ncbi:MAG: aminotransferase class V-fold PLP-dependent enzyme [Candidatus Cloacimonetes bacterium]|nr:aminotransferase class V-fold PLP-dependent enzyme [Candidatus Cloacimonadota bacterium]
MEIEKMMQELEWLRREIIGRNLLFRTCFGEKPLVYADYTASGRNLLFVENYMLQVMKYYANTHTEDDYTGKTMTTLLHEAEKIIKQLVNAGPGGKIIFTESGTTGGITRLQQILGVYWPPATKRRVDSFLKSCLSRYPGREKCNEQLLNYFDENKPVVFVGPYEHHSNEIMWRRTLCEVIEISLNDQGEIDLLALESTVSSPIYNHRPKIGSFSAASNVTGIKTPVYEVARILHEHNALACFDFAACAPYVEIDMNRDEQSCFDAIFLSPHKFLGGPGTSGLLIFNEKIYPRDLPPCIAAGGTVDYVSPQREKYIDDIETREKPGTPAILQNIKAALVFQLKEKVGIRKIETIEKFLIADFYNHFQDNSGIVLYGPTDPGKKVAIIPFNIVHGTRVLHPKFVTRLMNDLFGIQTRAGCSCAGPYGHRLLQISDEISRYYQCAIGLDHYSGLKPGWVRLNLHYTLSRPEYDYLVRVVDFMIKYACRFLPLYVFDFSTGDWHHISEKECHLPLTLEFAEVLQAPGFKPEIMENIEELFQTNLKKTLTLAESLSEVADYPVFENEIERLMFFNVINYVNKR